MEGRTVIVAAGVQVLRLFLQGFYGPLLLEFLFIFVEDFDRASRLENARLSAKPWPACFITGIYAVLERSCLLGNFGERWEGRAALVK